MARLALPAVLFEPLITQIGEHSLIHLNVLLEFSFLVLLLVVLPILNRIKASSLFQVLNDQLLLLRPVAHKRLAGFPFI